MDGDLRPYAFFCALSFAFAILFGAMALLGLDGMRDLFRRCGGSCSSICNAYRNMDTYLSFVGTQVLALLLCPAIAWGFARAGFRWICIVLLVAAPTITLSWGALQCPAT